MELKYNFEDNEFIFNPDKEDVYKFIDELDEEDQEQLIDAAWDLLDEEKKDELRDPSSNDAADYMFSEDGEIDPTWFVEEQFVGNFFEANDIDPEPALKECELMDALKDHFEEEAFAVYADLDY